MENISLQTVYIAGIGVFIILGILLFILIGKLEQVNQLRRALARMKRSFNELDEQAKLIVKTDLELNKAQDELDRRLNSLDALQKASRLISTTLDEEEIFLRLDQTLIIELGFEKNLILIYNQEGELTERVVQGFTEEEVKLILTHLEKDSSLNSELRQGHTFSSANAPAQRKQSISRIFSVEHFVLSPILTQNGIIGVVFVGNRSNASPITGGDEELISILANQIGQSVENARLFEQAFTSSKALETKIQDRTKQLANALKEVQATSKAKSEFISAVSHELRTPLTSIKGYASILMTGKLGEIPQKVKERLEKINMHSDRLVKLINDLLDIARIESGRVEMNLTRCQLPSIIDNVRDLLTPQMKEKNIKWRTDINAPLPALFLDAGQIERVFINLIGNAIKFTPENGKISIRAACDDSKAVTVEVSDTGIGIAPDDIEKLFQEFYKVDNEINANLKGTGLGLPLARKIIEAHSGRMWVTSELNNGTTFHFTLPINPKEE